MQATKDRNIVIKNEKSTLNIIEDNILHILYLKNSDLEIEDVKEVAEAYNSLPEPKPQKVLSEMESYVSITNEARVYAAEQSPDLIGIAYVISGLSQRLLLKFYVKLWKRKKPTQVFHSYAEALLWLKAL